MPGLQSPNLVVDKHWRVKVTDFNLSLIDGTTQSTGPISANNPRWLAPESIKSREYSTHSDVFSFGVRACPGGGAEPAQLELCRR